MTQPRVHPRPNQLGQLVQAQPATRVREQVDSPLLPAALNLNPCSSQHLFYQCKAQAQARAQEDDSECLAHVRAVSERAAQPFEEKAAGKTP